ncbi:MAG TPA: hypothetical protein PLZ08_05440 [Bacillota bacterium]|jgi:hypothetical protein|nr:hypothetical protein [Bacillota bacterium]HOL10966.1 hypothetical protein [Bacillota bacterium]HPO97385.1 hypothetical protein [Bacillota bacterium]
MGTKYANIYVRNKTLDEIEKVLINEHQNRSDDESFRVFQNLLGAQTVSNEQELLVKRLLKLSNKISNKYYIGEIVTD